MVHISSTAILNFLRVGAVTSFPSRADWRELLAIEADYHGIEELARAIHAPRVDTIELLSDKVLFIRCEEETLRKAFMMQSAQGYDPHHGLVSIFSPDHGIGILPLYASFANEGDLLMNTLREKAKRGTPVTVKSMEEFESNFNREHPNVLHRLLNVLLEEPVIIAGGSVLRALAGGEGT